MSVTDTIIPEKITARTHVAYRRTYGLYPADAGWDAKLYLIGPSAPAAVTASIDGASFVYTLDTAYTAALAAGIYTWEERVEKDGEQYVADSGRVQVLLDVTTATTATGQSFNQRLLAQVEAVINARFGVGGAAVDPAESYAIDGRSIVKMKTRELLDLRASLKRQVALELNPGRFGPQVQVQFSGLASEASAPWLGGTE